ncbi:hypothetical protein [Empedobacter sp. UBA5637]|uniref:hypothetical protein n=1 Tax=Empedobacter sp. UBA5637 TaxID=1946442 RepID=UPI0025BEE2D4|nr:hypothetical protein [Empedobacter sp. UBA5637]
MAYKLNKPKGNSPASPTKFNPTGFGVFVKDILSFPTRDDKGIRLLGDVVLKPGATFFEFYHTNTKADSSFETEAEQDMIKITPKFTTQHPGNEVESREFITDHLGEDVILFVGSCDEPGFDVIGEPCLPLQLVPSQTNNSDGKFFTLNWQVFGTTGQLNAFYEGNIIRGEIPKSTDKEVTINGAVSKVVQVASAAVTDTLTIATSNLKNNDMVTLIGSGGVAPYTLESAVAGGVTVILFNGTQWTALENASITLRYVDAGATKYLVEVARG